MDGIINVLKPSGMTSHDVVAFIRKKFNIKKVGHTGTLDPNAAGVLPICIGKGTKISQYIMQKTKKYRCEMIFEKETDTLDSYGQILNTKASVPPTIKNINRILEQFKGSITQVPPAYSAIKINGVKLYQKARKGEVIDEIPSRIVNIFDIELINYTYPRLMIDITCSSGTYVRSLVRDIAKSLDSIAYMSLLIRTMSGEFNIENSITLDELSNNGIENSIVPIININLNMNDIIIKSTAMTAYINGCEVSQKGIISDLASYNKEKVRVFDELNHFIGIGIINIESQYFLKSDTLFI